ncbi:MAG TPA: transposase, partial [Thermomicrobiales bacterium]|nr:transposase [Thermomicrobiales bacterium]
PPADRLSNPDPLSGYPSLSDMVGWFKTMTTNWYLHGVRNHGWPRYDGHLWQPSFHDRIVRSDTEMNRLREYIASNPALWNQDRFFEPLPDVRHCGGPHRARPTR